MFTQKKKKTRVYKNCQTNYAYIGPTLIMFTPKKNKLGFTKIANLTMVT
jgi:hypothetical protein